MRQRPVEPPTDGDEGFTLVETMVAIVLITVAIFALTAELAAYLHHQATEKSRTTAVRLMATTLETARRQAHADVASLNGTYTNPDPTGRYTTRTVVQHCTVADAPGACTTPASATVEDLRVRVTVSWNDGSTPRSVSSLTSLADDSDGQWSPTGSGTLSTLVGGAAQAAGTVAVSLFTASPSPVTVGSTGIPTSAVSLSMTVVGLTAATTSIPVTWTDDNGGHQATLTGGPSSYSATIPAASITKAVTSGTATVTFAATVPGTSALSTANLTVKPVVGITTCSVSPNPVLLTVLTRKTALTETLSCTTTGLSATDTVTASYPSGSGTATKSLTSSNGTSWSATLPAGTSMASGLALTEAFTFTATRASDSLSASSVVTAVLA